MAGSSTQGILASLHSGLQRWVRESGWPGLRPIQKAAIPVILSGSDCVVEAPTAGGKTEAVLFPALTRAATGRGEADGVRVLYLAPLRALLNNLQMRGEEYAAACGLEAFKWHGDVDQQKKIHTLSLPPALLMTTPESLEAILLRKAERAAFFSGLQTVILDEAHSFAAGDRGGHLLSLLERLEDLTGRSPQRIALSATVGNPDAMLHWLAGGSRQPGRRVRVIGSPGERDFRVHLFSDRGEPGEDPEQSGKYRRFRTLLDLLPGKRSLVFVRSRAGAEKLAKGFADLNDRLPPSRRIRVQTHHSAVSKFFREEAEQLIQMASRVSEDRLDAIISTSTLELGIDIGALNRVVQMDALASPSGFLQRVGRTGRRGEPQFFRGLCTKPDDLVVLAAAVNLGWKLRSENLILLRRAFHLLAHQLLCLALVDQDYLRCADGVLVIGDATEREFLRAGWRRLFAVFDSAPLYEVVHQRQPVGTLDAGFVEALEVPFYFVLGGKVWKAEAVDAKSRIVRAVRSRSGDAPSWTSFGGPGVPFETAQEAGELLYGYEPLPEFLDPEARDMLEVLKGHRSERAWYPGGFVIQVEAAGSARIITFAGDRINRTLARALECLEIGRCAGRYDEVELKKGLEGRAELEAAIGGAIERIRTGVWSEAEALAIDLQQIQPLWPFSPFVRLLPRDLWAAALLEQTLDCEGLVRFLQGPA
jgi:ATP-dependent Lhr-like helicase